MFTTERYMKTSVTEKVSTHGTQLNQLIKEIGTMILVRDLVLSNKVRANSLTLVIGSMTIEKVKES